MLVVCHHIAIFEAKVNVVFVLSLSGNDYLLSVLAKYILACPLNMGWLFVNSAVDVGPNMWYKGQGILGSGKSTGVEKWSQV